MQIHFDDTIIQGITIPKIKVSHPKSACKFSLLAALPLLRVSGRSQDNERGNRPSSVGDYLRPIGR